MFQPPGNVQGRLLTFPYNGLFGSSSPKFLLSSRVLVIQNRYY